MKRRIPRLQGIARRFGKGELIGLHAKVADAHDRGLVGLEGEVIDETLRTLTLRIGGPGGRRVQVAKLGATFAFSTPGFDKPPVEVEGAALEFRPEDRVKKVR